MRPRLELISSMHRPSAITAGALSRCVNRRIEHRRPDRVATTCGRSLSPAFAKTRRSTITCRQR